MSEFIEYLMDGQPKMAHEQFILSIPHEFTLGWSGNKQVEAVVDFDHLNGAIHPDSIWVAFHPYEGSFITNIAEVMGMVQDAIDNYMASREETIIDSLNKLVDRKETKNY